MDWRELYTQRHGNADEVVRHIRDNDRVLLANAVGEPALLVDAMVRNKSCYQNVTVSQMATLGTSPYCLPKNRDCFRPELWFLSNGTRKCVECGYGHFVPVHLHEVPKFIRSGIFRVDVMMLSVSPPDENGYVSTGVSSDYTMQGVRSARTVLAEINDQIPVTYGDTKLHISEIDAFVESSRKLPEIPISRISEVGAAIGRHCAALIQDGSTLQIGIGGIPDAILSQLGEKRHLGIHSEMLSDGVVELYQKGVIDNSRKAIDRGKGVATFLMGSKKLYDFVNHNPDIELRTADYVNSPLVIAQHSRMVSINSCLQVDLFGQIAADIIGSTQFSGVGGQADFVRRTRMAIDGNGISIIALASTAIGKGGTVISKIVPSLPAGTAVTTMRQDVDYIVTEYGVAYMRGKTIRDRAKSLIQIAHPQFRVSLQKQFTQKFHADYRAG